MKRLHLGLFFGCSLGLSLSAQAVESDRLAPSTLRFLPNSVQNPDTALVSGGVLNLEFDAIRLANCRGKNKEGLEDWNIQAFIRVDDLAPQSFDLIQGRGTLYPVAVPINFALLEGRQVSLWFKASDTTGCVQWDSNNSQNYKFAIEQLEDLPTLSFNSNWQIEQTGELKAGKAVRLHYDLDRATQCRTGGYHGSASWSILPQVRVDGQAVPALPVTYSKSWSEIGQQDIIVTLPYGKELTVWFENSGYEYYAGRSCKAYDSNFGKNYKFQLH